MKSYVNGKHNYYFNQDILTDFNSEFFSCKYWQKNNQITGQAFGRGTTYFINHSRCQMVLRHYFRGGLIGKLIDDSYFFTGIKNTRAAKEFLLLEQLQTWQLPAPKPLAFHIERSLFSYRADILIELIPEANDLVAILSKEQLTESQWQNIGKTIKQFHDHNIYHHDLNAHNIMIDKDENVWLIDFDRGEVRSNGEWKQANIARLERSFNKERNLLDKFHFTKQNFDWLLAGYNAK